MEQPERCLRIISCSKDQSPVNSRVRILFAYTSLASFVERDLKILKERHEVVPRNIYYWNPFRLISDLLGVFSCDAVFLWFVSIHALPIVVAAKLFRKKIVSVVGGYEAVNLPEIDYGSARSPLRRMLVRFMLHCANRIVAVSRSSQDEIVENLRVSRDRTTLIYHGFENTALSETFVKKPVVINVGHVSAETVRRKGIDDFVLAAAAMPDVEFVQIGPISVNLEEALGRKLPPNLTLEGKVSLDELINHFLSAKVYLQLSRHEGFGCSVAEAMLFGCIPVVTNAFALPEVVGDCGITLTSRNQQEVVKAVRSALAMPDSEGLRARKRILDHFSYEQRRQALLKLLSELE